MSEQPHDPATETSGYNRRLLRKLAVVAVVMFGFGFAMVPIYRAICEATGIGLMTKRDTGAETFARNTQVDTSRTVVVEFDSNSRGEWLFKPEKRTITVHPGELATIEYELVNAQDRPMAGQAIPSYMPRQSAAYFRKVECFCFQQQSLEAKETRRFPVVFVIDPALPRNVESIMLSYTFFEVGGKQAAAADPKGS